MKKFKNAKHMKAEQHYAGKASLLLTAICVTLGSIFLFVAGSGPAQTPPPKLPAGVQDVVKLAKAGLGEEVILAQIKSSGAAYNLSVDQILYLNSQGVSQNVIKALMQNSNPGSAPAVTPAVPSLNPPPGNPIPGLSSPALTPPPGPLPASAAPASFDSFRAQLTPYGAWIDMPGYGLVWRPTVAAADPYWRPYCDQGHWVYTDEGWSWQSDYPWGEIAFHYGRWLRGGLGWVWVPAYDWAPAWVCWRHSEGYSGWAPLPPGAVFRAGIGLTFNGRLAVDVGFGLGPEAFTFVPYDHFWDHSLRAFILPRDRVDFVFGRSVIRNGYRLDHGRFVVEGIGRDRMAGYTHREIRVERAGRGREERVEHREGGRRDEERRP